MHGYNFIHHHRSSSMSSSSFSGLLLLALLLRLLLALLLLAVALSLLLSLVGCGLCRCGETSCMCLQHRASQPFIAHASLTQSTTSTELAAPRSSLCLQLHHELTRSSRERARELRMLAPSLCALVASVLIVQSIGSRFEPCFRTICFSIDQNQENLC